MKLPARRSKRLLTPPKPTIPVPGAQLIAARLQDVRRVLADLSAEDLSALDADLGEWIDRPLGREALATVVLPAAGSLFVVLMNVEPSGLILLERGSIAAHVRVLAIAPDLRGRGLAQSVLKLAEREVGQRRLTWQWMLIASDNVAAIRCALRAGFRRFQPQFLRRKHTAMPALTNLSARFALLEGERALSEATRWIDYECVAGDPWCAELARADLLKLIAPNEGQVYRCIVDEREAGLLHIEWTADSHLRLRLWLEERLWGDAREREIVKGALDMLEVAPAVIDLEFGSSGHLRASIELFRPFGFAPEQFERVTFAKRIETPQSGDIHESDEDD
jgi:ribosomal protein S18 acetylase RimI-like enzyme